MASVLAVAGCEDTQQPANPPQTAPPTPPQIASQTAAASNGTTDQADPAERFAPHVWLADLDAYDPMAADEFVDGAELRWAHDRGCGNDPITAEPTDAWTQHHCSEPDQLPAAMRGEWRSPKPADQPSTDKTYYVHLTLTGGAVDTDVGKVDYPGFECGGSLTLLAVEPDTVTLTETITDDSGGVSCAPSGTVTLTRNGDVLDMAYATEDGEQMTTRLARQPG